MTQYTMVDLVTGQQTTLSEINLTRKLAPNCILLAGQEHIGIITHRDLVVFTRWCVGEMLTRSGHEPDQRAVHALVLVDRWLEDQQSVTPEELKDTAEAVWAAGAARAAAEAAWSAARTAWSAGAAVWAAGAAEDYGLSYKSQAQWLVQHLQSGN